MEIKRIDTYDDSRFSKRVLRQHGGFTVDGVPYEVEICSEREGVIRGEDPAVFGAVLEEFRFYSPHITRFRNEKGEVVKEWPDRDIFTVPLEAIQPSQFYADKEKVAAVSTFLERWEDIVIQVLPHEGRFISLDGHTRLFYAVARGWTQVRAVAEEADDWVYAFADEAARRGVRTPKDLKLLEHEEYLEKWIGFCDAFFGRTEPDETS